jgi:TatA/E family protein of Tat protein translocase
MRVSAKRFVRRLRRLGIRLDNLPTVTYHVGSEVDLFSGEFASIGFILFLAFLLFGPKKLPDIARALGKGLGELRRASNELRSSFEEEIRNLERPTDGTSEPAPQYGHDYTEPTHEETEPRT